MIYKAIEKHFKTHFQKNNIEETGKFNRHPQKLKKEISKDEVKEAVRKMANNKAPRKRQHRRGTLEIWTRGAL